MRRPDSVLTTQEDVFSLEKKIRTAEEKLRHMKDRLDRLITAHREQIRRSLTSAISEERQMAESIAQWWSVLPTSAEQPREQAGAGLPAAAAAD